MTSSGRTSITTCKAPRTVPFLDLARQHRAMRVELEEAMGRVLLAGRFVLGPEVEAFEDEFARYIGTRFAVGVGSGTDAIHLALRACGVGPGDEVLTVSHTAVATVAAVELAGARPVLVDVDAARGTIDVGEVARHLSGRSRAVVPVHLYGVPADMPPLLELADRHGLRVIEDCAQAHGARYGGQRVGSLGDLGCFSFYPTKNLGALGDGGMVTTNDAALADRVRVLREYGWERRNLSRVRGVNSRLDELQAAVLRVKLPRLDEWNAQRRQVGARYADAAKRGGLTMADAPPGAVPAFHLAVVQSRRRHALAAHLAARGIQTLVHYPVPVHLQEAYRDLDRRPGSLAVSERLAERVLSLPLYPEMTGGEVEAVAGALADWVDGSSDWTDGSA